MRPLLLLTLMFCLSGQLQAGGFDHGHGQWTSLLARHVTWIDQGVASRVDYRGIQRDRAELDAYLAELSSVSSEQFDGWNRDRRLAFLINA
jgi:hypothetical protein